MFPNFNKGGKVRTSRFKRITSKGFTTVVALAVVFAVLPQSSASASMTRPQVPSVNDWNFHISDLTGSQTFTSPDDSVVIATTGPRTVVNFSTILDAFFTNHTEECLNEYSENRCEVASNSDASYLYAHTNLASVYVSRNMGTTWTKVADSIGGREAAEVGLTIAVSPDGSSIAFASYVDGSGWYVFYSNNYGSTFTNISSDWEWDHDIIPNYKAMLFSTNFDLYIGNARNGGVHNEIYKVSFPPRVSVQTGSLPNSQVATIPSGVTQATIPATSMLPATKLNFGGTVPTAVTVVPVTTNPASTSSTPFTISGSTKIVDIQISGTFTGSATVCLDGAETDHLFHFTGGAWVELPSRSYVGGQVCGVTTSFSPFAAAPRAAVSLVASTAAADAAAKAAADAAAAKREAEKQAARTEITSKLQSAKDLTVDEFAKAEIAGITASNIGAIQAELLALPEATRTDINQVLKVAHKYEVVGNIGSDRVSYMQSNSYVEIGLIPSTSKNKVALVAAIRNLPANSRDTYSEIKAAIDAETARIQARKDRLAAAITRNTNRNTK